MLAIHEGNFARYRISPSEFEGWNAVWNASGNATTKRKDRDSSVGR